MSLQLDTQILNAQTYSRSVSSDVIEKDGWVDRLTAWSIWALLIGGGFIPEVLGQTQVVSLGFFTLHAVDPGIALTALACACNILHRRIAWHAFTIPIVLLATLVVINFFRGLSVNPAPALLWIRANGGIATVLLLSVTMRPTLSQLSAARRGLIVCSFLLCILLVLRTATHPTLFMTTDLTDDDVNDGGRALSAFGTFLMVLTSAATMSDLLRRRRLRMNLRTCGTLALPVFIVLTRQGTANIAEIFALGTVLFFQASKGQMQRVVLGLGGLAIASAVIFAILPLLSSNQEVLHRVGNFGTRASVWRELMSLWPHQSSENQLLGLPAGESLKLLIFANGRLRVWENSMHSMYYGALPIAGYLGLICYVAILALLIVGTLTAMNTRTRPIPAYPLAMCVATAVLSFSYEVRGECLIGLFVAVWWVRVASMRSVWQRNVQNKAKNRQSARARMLNCSSSAPPRP